MRFKADAAFTLGVLLDRPVPRQELRFLLKRSHPFFHDNVRLISVMTAEEPIGDLPQSCASVCQSCAAKGMLHFLEL